MKTKLRIVLIVTLSLVWLILFVGSDVALSAWEPPIGIPRPDFGIEESYRMYDDVANRNPALTYYQNAEGGYYTHYVDNTDSNATDTNNPYGSVSKPRKTVPNSVPLGSVVEVHSALPQSGYVFISGEGTSEKPIFIRGVGNPRIEGTLSVGYYHGKASYIIVEGISFFAGEVVGSTEGTAFNTSYISIRNSDFHGDENSGAFKIRTSTSYRPENIVFYNNAVHDNGIWDPEIATGDRDIGGIGIAKASYVWIIDNEMYHNEMDGIQILGSAEFTHHIYVGRNIAHHNKQTGFWTKTAADVIFSENIAYGHRASSSDPFGAGLGLQYDPKRVWFLFNHVYDNSGGIACASSDAGGGEEFYFIGNIIHNITNRGIHFYGNEGEIYAVGNTIYDAGEGIRGSSGPCLYAFNNIIANLKSSDSVHLNVMNTAFAAASNASYNLFYQESGRVRINWGDNTNYNVSQFKSAYPNKSEGCIEADPQFVDADNGNFHLQATSPATDAGTSSGIVKEVFDKFEQLYGIDIRRDFDGSVRPYGAEWDIGAYEYVGSVNTPPVAIIQTDSISGEAPLTVNFDATRSYDPDGSIVGYSWDFGDGATSTGIKTSHTFTSAGEYTVTLTVTDGYGFRGESQTHIMVFEKEFGELPAGCYNNVFNPAKGEKALIVVELRKQAHVKLSLYNTRGSKIRELADEEKEAGTHKYYWDGKSGNGDVVGSGLYFADIQTGDYRKTKKIVVVK